MARTLDPAASAEKDKKHTSPVAVLMTRIAAVPS